MTEQPETERARRAKKRAWRPSRPMRFREPEVVVSCPGWWLDHIDELVAGLHRTMQAVSPEERRPVVESDVDDDQVVVADPRWWANHPDELEAALRQAVLG